MEHHEQGRLMAEAFSLISARRSGLDDYEFGQLLSRVYTECIDPKDYDASAERHGLLLLHLTRIAATALAAWAKHDSAAVTQYLSTLVKMSTDLQAGG